MALSDDAALYTATDGHEIVVTKDAVVEGVHFLEDETPEAVAARALRVNLSDLAAMGARPTAYFMALMLPERLGADWLGRFVDQLATDQDFTKYPSPAAIRSPRQGRLRCRSRR